MYENPLPKPHAPLIFLHGLGSGAWSMCALAARFDRQGFDVEILSYRSNGRSLAQMTDEIQSSLPERIINRFDIVAHSLGGLVGHQLAARLGASTISKVAMLGSPFLGTRAATVPAPLQFTRRMGKSLRSGLGKSLAH